MSRKAMAARLQEKFTIDFQSGWLELARRQQWERLCRMFDGHKLRPAHQIAYELANGPIPEGLEIGTHASRHATRPYAAALENPLQARTSTIRRQSENNRPRQTNDAHLPGMQQSKEASLLLRSTVGRLTHGKPSY